MKDKDNFNKLITDLTSHSESLYRLCPENAFESMNIYLTMECLARQESPAGLKSTSRLAIQQAEVDGRSSVREGYELLASVGTLKASVNENSRGEPADNKTLASVNEEQCEMWYLGKGLTLFEGHVVHVEMRDYRGPPLEPTPEQKQQMKRCRKRARFLRSLSTNGMMTSHYNQGGMNQTYKSISSDEDEEDDEPIEMVRPADPQLQALIRTSSTPFKART